MDLKRCAENLSENLREHKKQILAGVFVSVLIICLVNIAAWISGAYIPAASLIMIIGAFTAGFLISRSGGSLKSAAISGFITYFVVSMILMSIDLLSPFSSDVAFPSASTSIILTIVYIIFTAPVFSLSYGIFSALSGYLIYRKENLKLAAAGGLLFPMVFTGVVILSSLLFANNESLSFEITPVVISGKLLILAATGIVFSSGFPLFEKVMMQIKDENKISRIIFFGIAISGMVALLSAAFMLLLFNVFLFLVLFSCALLFSFLCLLVLETRKNPDALKIALLMGIGLASIEVIPSGISAGAYYLIERDAFTQTIMSIYPLYIHDFITASAFLISPLVVFLALNWFSERSSSI